MKHPAETVPNEPILVDRAANYFGTEGAGFHLRSSLRGNGVLTLTEDRLVFDQYLTGTRIEIPLERISRLGVGLWHRFRASGVPVLKITYDQNLVFGVAVAHPERWITAIESLGKRRGRVPLVESRTLPLGTLRRFRLILGVVLLFLLFLSVLLPLLLSWVHNRSVHEIRMDGAALPGGALESPPPRGTGTLG